MLKSDRLRRPSIYCSRWLHNRGQVVTTLHQPPPIDACYALFFFLAAYATLGQACIVCSSAVVLLLEHCLCISWNVMSLVALNSSCQIQLFLFFFSYIYNSAMRLKHFEHDSVRKEWNVNIFILPQHGTAFENVFSDAETEKFCCTSCNCG